MSKRTIFRCYLIFVTFFIAGTYFFIYLQWSLISSPLGFFATIIIFLILSFLVSAAEMAFATAPGKKNIQAALNKERVTLTLEYAKYEEKLGKLDYRERKKVDTIFRKENKLDRKERALKAPGNDVFIGTFASLGVFFNTALAVSLPIFLLSPTNNPNIGTQLYFPYWLNVVDTGPSYSMNMIYTQIAPDKALVFMAASILILVLGKVLPKKIGRENAYYFSYAIYPMALIAAHVFGWIPIAIYSILNKN